MSHKLLIVLEVDPKEVISRTSFKSNFTFNNIGNTPFPGGKVTRLTAKFNQVHTNYSVNKIIRISRIDPGESQIIQQKMFAGNEGICWIELSVVSDDSETVDLYINKDINKGQNWMSPIYIFGYETMKSLDLLKQILEKLEEISSKIGVT